MFFLFLEILAGKGGGEMERFACRTEIISGRGTLSVLSEKKSRRLLVVTGQCREEMLRQVITAAGNPETALFQDVDAVPTMKQAVEGSRKIQAFQPDLVIALGDRGTLDCAKAMVCFSGCHCCLAAVPTAFGAGSEVTDRVTLAHNGRRHLMRHEAMRPALAVLDPAMTEICAAGECGEGGFAVLSSALEAYTSAGAGLIRDIHAREAFASAWAALPAAFSGNAGARHRLQLASALCGMAAEQTGLGLCRAMENSLGVVFGLSRGKAAAMLLPAIIGCNAHAAGKRYAELSRAAGLGGSREEIGIRNLKSGLIRLRRELGLPGSLVQAGVDLRKIWGSGKQIAELTLEDPECRNNPLTVDDFMVRRILEEITGRI